MNEISFLPETLKCISRQDFHDFTVTICVNQPETWHDTPEKLDICKNNAETIDYISHFKDFPIHLIDKSSRGNGWRNNEGGVGFARKTVMDSVIKSADPHDIIVSLDSDTLVNPSYLHSIFNTFRQNHSAVALSVPYYHRLTGDERANRAILRYEIYMRNYAMNLWRIQCPYNFTALGSAIALRVSAYKAIGGMTPKKSGEDFYFLQKLRKYGPVLTYNPEKAYPAARFSDRVFFGTGPAMIKGDLGDWNSYPVYHYELFDRVKETYKAFETLYDHDIETPMSPFLHEIFKGNILWKPLRENFRDREKFIRACHEKVDALRILQYLKSEEKKKPDHDEENLRDFLAKFYPDCTCIPEKFDSFDSATVAELDTIRNFLVGQEEEIQKRGSW